MLKSATLIILLVMFTSSSASPVNFEHHIIEGLPVFLVNNDASICNNYDLRDFRKIQIEYGLLFANSALQCRFSKLQGTPRETVFLAIDPGTKCGLVFDSDDKTISDPCANRKYNLTGRCIAGDCGNSLIQVYATRKDGKLKMLLDGTTLVEFDGLDNLTDIPNGEKLAMGMINNSELTVNKILSAGDFDLNYIYQGKFSLVEVAIKTGEAKILKYLLENNAEFCAECSSMVEYLRNSLRAGSLQTSAILIEYGVKPGNICEQLLFLDSKKLANCE